MIFKNKKIIKFLILLIVALLISLFFYFDLARYFHFNILKLEIDKLQAYKNDHSAFSLVCFWLFYTLFVGVSLPGATILSIASGAIFGMYWGCIIVSFAFSIGSTLSFLSSRILFQDIVQKYFGKHFDKINEGFNKDGIFYLFTLRITPIFPYTLVNLVLGLTSVKVWTFYWITQIGSLATVLIYVNAGTQLAKINSIGDIFTPNLLCSLILLGLFPLLVKIIIKRVQK